MNSIFYYSYGRTDILRIIGSSTVHPYISSIIENYTISGGNLASAESLGSGIGISYFCSGKFEGIASSSRPMKIEERQQCIKNGISFEEHILGYDAVVLVVNRDNIVNELTTVDVYKALAQKVLVKKKDNTCVLEDNTSFFWSDIRSDLPRVRISMYGPSSFHGTYSVFMTLLVKHGYQNHECYFSLSDADKSNFWKSFSLRNSVWKEINLNYSTLKSILLLSALKKESIIVSHYSLFYLSRKTFKLVSINSVSPDYDSILDASYMLRRPLFLYYSSSNQKAKELIKFVRSSPETIAKIKSQGLIILP